MIVNLGTKLTSINFDQLIKLYWEESISEKSKVVDFSFKKLEWIGFEQLTFITGWMDILTLQNKSINIYLQDSSDILTQSETYTKRQKCLKLILSDWKIQRRLSDKIQLHSGGINVKKGTKASSDIPFEYIPIIKYNFETFEDDFSLLYKKHLKNFKTYSENEFKENSNLNYFDNHFLNYSIVKELYSNVCQHAFGNNINSENKSYISLFYNKKIEQKYESDFLQKLLTLRYSERPIEETNFFLNNNKQYTNRSYLEFTFLDFGQGIAETLKGKYVDQKFETIKDKLSPKHLNQNLDSKVLEYAFLLFTSKYEFSEDLKIHDYIPRGLYIIKDIIKRYKGLIIVRSRKGKVVFDFSKSEIIDLSDSVKFRENDFDDRISNFPGTSITVVLPTKEQSEKDETSFDREVSATPKLKFLNILKLFSKNQKRYSNEDQKENERIFYENFFNELCTILGELNTKNSHFLICFDFAGISNENKGFYTKLTYFLSYSPLINENVNTLLFNVLDKGVNEAQLEFEKRPSSVGFFPHIIPCIHPDLDISWIGIHEPILASRLTENWKGDNSYETNSIKNPEIIAGNILKIFRTDTSSIVKCRIPQYQIITEEIIKYQKRFINNEIDNKGIRFDDLTYIDEKIPSKNHDYNYINKSDPDGRAYLTANGKYQMIFLSFIEKLYKKEYRRLIATYFIFNLYNSSKLTSELKRKINKILTVTLSSQLLGKEVKDILEILSLPKTTEITLIPLSSYYDFYNEQRFSEIIDNDTLLVVNDVISTGYLSKRILNSINKKRKNVSVTILTIVDSRQHSELTKTQDETILALTEFPIEKIEPDDFRSDKEPIWINPILNAPITMSIDKSNIQNILLTPNEFLDSVIDNSFYKVGLFKRNTIYHTYYLETDRLFKEQSESKAFLLDILIPKLVARKHIDDLNNINDNILKICNQIELFEFNNGEVNNIDIVSILKTFQNALKQQKKHEVKFDFVFYPFLSSVSYFENEINIILNDFKGDNAIEIYPIPRIMTPKGWRFTFPPKFLNHITKGKNILILDDGSCSGDTIVQMIDTISFLEVKDITVLSIFARLEDYNREFLTRINEVKIKDHSIPVKIYFGTHFNIPIYNKINNPYSKELDELDKYDLSKISIAVKKYVEKRKEQIKAYLEYEEILYPLIPDFVLKKEMFRIRNIIGRFDSYRLYKEDDPLIKSIEGTTQPTREYLLDIISKEDGFNAMIAVLIHEPKLIDTINRVYPPIIKFLKKRLDEIFSQNELIKHINNKIFYLRILSFINLRTLLNPEIILNLFEQIDSSIKQTEDIILQNSFHDTYNYFAFILYCINENKLINYESIDLPERKLLFDAFIENISTIELLSSNTNTSYKNLFREFISDYRESILVSNQSELITAFSQMYEYFYKDMGKKSHQIIYARFNEFIISFTSPLETEQEKEIYLKEYADVIIKVLSEIIPRIKLILESFKHFSNYIHSFNVETTLSIINKVENTLIEIQNKTIKNIKATDVKGKLLALNLEEFNNKILDSNANLIKYLQSFLFKPVVLMNKIFGKEKNQKLFKEFQIEISFNYADEFSDLKLLSHSFFFETIFQEIFSNVINHAKTAKCEISHYLEADEYIINFKQNLPKFEKAGENGIRDFRKIASLHEAEFIEKNLLQYEYEFRFPSKLIYNKYDLPI